MNRRDFLKHASLAAIGTSTVVKLGAAQKRVAFGGMQIECSTYGGNLSRMEDFTIRRGKEVSDVPFFSVLKGYPYPFMPTLFATAVPGPPVERKTYDAIKAEFLGARPRPAAARRPLSADARRDVRRGDARRRGGLDRGRPCRRSARSA